MTAQQAGEHAAEAAHGAEEGFNAGEVIIEHVANSPPDHPIIRPSDQFFKNMIITPTFFLHNYILCF